MKKTRTFVDEREEQVPFHSDIEPRVTMPETMPTLRYNGLGSRNQLMIRSDVDTLVDDEQEPPSDGSVLEGLISQWAEVAVSHAIVREINDPSGLIATVVGIEGAWGFGAMPEEAMDELRSVLIDWARLKLEDGDDDIPSMEGVHLVVDR